jgi:MoaA/NifB/PqqE/SkfB family radical SAM enzyme
MFHRRPRLDWVQIEITSLCDGTCIYCPKTVYAGNWQNRHMPLQTYTRLIPFLNKTKLIHLQGWGEPLVHPDFFKMAALAKKTGALVSTTTNGNQITQKTADQIVESGIDMLCFSLAGMDEKNDRFRQGTRIRNVLAAIERVHRAKAARGSDHPAVHIAYMLLKSGLDDLEKLPRFLFSIGADQTVVSSLSLILHEALIPEAILAATQEAWRELTQRLLGVYDQGRRLNTDIYFHIVSPDCRLRACTENIENAVVIGSNGEVSPCVMKNLPVTGDNYYFFNRQKFLYQGLSFGSIDQEPLHRILHKESRRRFIRLAQNRVPAACAGCYKRCIDPIQPVDLCLV